MSRKPAKKARPRKKKEPVQHPHFAIGLPVCVRMGALPVGWPEGESFMDYWYPEDYDRSYPIQGVHDDDNQRATFEVMGWFWRPEDLYIAYR